MGDTIPQGVPTPQSETQRKLDLNMKLEGVMAWRDSDGYLAAGHTQVVAMGGISEPNNRDY